jgi:amidophosphoribosyltransferase
MQEILTTVKRVRLSVFTFREEAMLKYIKRKNLGRLILPAVLSAIEQDTDNTVFLIFQIRLKLLYGLVEAAQDFLNQRKKNYS